MWLAISSQSRATTLLGVMATFWIFLTGGDYCDQTQKLRCT